MDKVVLYPDTTMPGFILELSFLEKILFGAFALFLIMQLYYYVYFFFRLAFYKREKVNDTREPVSVIICAKNEEDNLKKNLPLILEQDYPNYEVVVVNDRSVDDSIDILRELSAKYSHLQIVEIKDDEYIKAQGKKFALTLGIKRASHDILLMTDADCLPDGKQWLQTMKRNFDEETDIVLGFGGYEKRKGFLNILIRFDTFLTALQYFSYALAGLTYMGVGRNMAYRKHLFFDNKGFGSHNHIASGDDDLFINKVAQKAKVRIELEKASHTMSAPKETWAEWVHQKKRHLTTGFYYRLKHKLLLGFFGLSQVAFNLLFILILSISDSYYLAISLYSIRLISQLIVNKTVMSKLQMGDLWLISPVLDLILPLVNIFLSVSNLFFKPRSWK